MGSAVAAVDTDVDTNGNGDTLVYTLGGTDAAHFSIVSSSGQIQTESALDFETKSNYRVTVSVSDGKDSDGSPDTAADDTVTVIVEVGDVEEAGTMSLSPSVPRVKQTVTASLTDPDGDVTGTVWRWERSTGANTWTVIPGAESTAYTSTTADVDTYLRPRPPIPTPAGRTRPRRRSRKAQYSRSQSPMPVFSPLPLPQPVAPPPPPVPLDLFSDLGSTGVHETAVRTLAAAAVLTDTGCGSGLLCPGEPLPRWEMAVWLVCILDIGDPAKHGDPSKRSADFVDADPAEWWASHVRRLVELQITLGCSTTPAQFCPHDTVTRSQTASFLTRAFKLRPPLRSPGFQDTKHRFNATHINALHAAGITKGCKAQPLLYCPAHKTTRAQMASFLHRASR